MRASSYYLLHGVVRKVRQHRGMRPADVKPTPTSPRAACAAPPRRSHAAHPAQYGSGRAGNDGTPAAFGCTRTGADPGALDGRRQVLLPVTSLPQGGISQCRLVGPHLAGASSSQQLAVEITFRG